MLVFNKDVLRGARTAPITIRPTNQVCVIPSLICALVVALDTIDYFLSQSRLVYWRINAGAGRVSTRTDPFLL